MKRFAVIVLFLAALASGAWAQQKDSVLSETVIVTAPRLTPEVRTMLHDFVTSYTAPATLSGQLTRWARPICPRTDGLSRDELTSFVTQRIRVIAGMAGVKVAPTPCRPNIEIYFTEQPQKVLDVVRAKEPNLLGYHGPLIVSHPVQAWYVTGTRGLDGPLQIDQEVFSNFKFSGNDQQIGKGWMDWGVPIARVGGYRLRKDIRSEFVNVVVIADKTRTGDLQLGPVADYIALMALARAAGFETCQNMASITNLMAPDCSRRPDGITDVDLGFLRGLYKMNPDEPLLVQQTAITDEMVKSLGRQPEGSR